ncbi:hypothetical protein F2P81_015145 [Scophthalmus maximus]|uniref:Ig-like domain-containing protein n=1 Tax=Scophthalmus maximus TaxID=52904 RepID=A0A6A4SJZ8_SCOMX|nr:hypothetical protein F2P81_015145 [Scophthalmus maximus]
MRVIGYQRRRGAERSWNKRQRRHCSSQMSESRPFVRLLVGLVLTATGVHASCPIELSPPSVVVRYGDPVSVNCSTSEIQHGGMGWEATQGGRSLEYNVQHLTWTVENLTDWPISPSCFLNMPNEQCSRKPKVVLYTFPENISIGSSSGPDGVMREGHEYNITCLVHNVAPVQHLTVTWYKGDSPISRDTFDNGSKKPTDQPSVYSLTPTRRDNGATFRCEAQMDLGPEGPRLNVSSAEHSVTVHYGPDIKSVALNLLEGGTLKSHYLVEGNPTPSVKWMKDGRRIDPSIPLSRNDTGQYVVEAEGASSVKRKLQVFVMYGPELSCPSWYTALENTPNNLTCTVEGFPKPETTWYKDGEEVDLPKNPDRGDAGQYVVTASNNVSSVNVTVEFDVLYAPSPIVELEDSEVEVGSSVLLKCSSGGKPRPTYFWEYYQTANVAEENEDGVTRLLIHNATADNMGSYRCHASNHVGGVHKTARVTVKGAKQECPIEITPDRMVLRYRGPSQNAACRLTSAAAAGNVKEKTHGWDVRGFVTFNESWSADTREDWDARPVCTATFWGMGECNKSLDFTLYKTPDNILIRPVHDAVSQLVEGSVLQLRCDIISVAPAQNLVVRWYQGNDTLEHLIGGPLRVTGCLPENGTNCDIGEIRSPLNVSSTISIPLNRTHSGAEFSCVAQMDLGAEGPQPPPNVMSGPFNVTVHCEFTFTFAAPQSWDKMRGDEGRSINVSTPTQLVTLHPTNTFALHFTSVKTYRNPSLVSSDKPAINSKKLPKRIPVFRGYPEELTCEADGQPPPKIQWLYSPDKLPRVSEDTLTVSEAGIYNCTATNEVDSVFYVVEVILKEDYLPLIAGFVAVTVVAISIVFLFIYSIYYKNTRMRRYSLKNPKPNNHTGNVAHNGWDMQFPMTKLS